MPAEMNIEVPRNGSYFQRWTFRDRLTREPLDISEWTFALDIKSAAGAPGSPVGSAIFSDVDGPGGGVNVRIDGADLSEVEGAQEIVRLAYDFLGRDEESVITVEARGQIILMPGVSTL